eukprot:scaffold2120_cov169-Amphora_coffeaeformis.AAC.4
MMITTTAVTTPQFAFADCTLRFSSLSEKQFFYYEVPNTLFGVFPNRCDDGEYISQTLTSYSVLRRPPWASNLTYYGTTTSLADSVDHSLIKLLHTILSWIVWHARQCNAFFKKRKQLRKCVTCTPMIKTRIPS